jgi:DNA-binding Lrp family transcriptional regulator
MKTNGLEQLTERERKMIALIAFNPESTAAELGRRLKMNSSTVAYTKRQLLERGILQRSSIIDFYRLGFLNVMIFFSLKTTHSTGRKLFLKELCASEKVAWVGTLAGEFQYGVACLVKNLAEVRDLFEEQCQKVAVTITDKLIAPRLSMSFLERGDLTPKSGKREAITIEMQAAPIDVDALDQKILYALATQPFHDVPEIARSIGAPYGTVERRVRGLHANNTVPLIPYWLNTDQLGIISSRILVHVASVNRDFRLALYEWTLQHPKTTQFVHSLGPWDFEIDFDSASSQEVAQFSHELTDRFGNEIERIRVMTLLEDLKFCMYPLCPPK